MKIMNDDLFPQVESAPPRPSLFVAILPPVELRQPIVRLRTSLMRKHRLAGYLTPETKFHITLCHFNDNPESMDRIIQCVSQACERAAGSTTPFAIRLNEVTSYGGGACVLVDQAENVELQAFHHSLLLEMANLQFTPRKSSGKISPHLTLLRDVTKIRAESIDPIGWMADEVVLVRHVPREEYEIIGPWKFGG